MGEFWEATAKDTAIAADQAVEVVGMDGMFLVNQLRKKLNSSGYRLHLLKV
jgi:membrane-bound ClpP family serine protease